MKFVQIPLIISSFNSDEYTDRCITLLKKQIKFINEN